MGGGLIDKLRTHEDGESSPFSKTRPETVDRVLSQDWKEFIQLKAFVCSKSVRILQVICETRVVLTDWLDPILHNTDFV